MAAAAVGLLVVLSVEGFKATSRFYNKRKSLKHGYCGLRTDALGRPINEYGVRLSRNQAKALAAHNQEMLRLRALEREWMSEQLPKYESSSPDMTVLQRPTSAPLQHSNTGSHTSEPAPEPARTRAMSAILLSESCVVPITDFTVRRHTNSDLVSQATISAHQRDEDILAWARYQPPTYHQVILPVNSAC